ncbi:MAG: hypothetical protein KDA61_03730 [Planctomycetales bacterium]|nr:hypothetical protein [Planctomycetales bacterium]
MLCPYCLSDVESFSELRDGAGVHETVRYHCPVCNERTPKLYVVDYDKYPNVIVDAVGFTSHGKSVFIGSLFYEMRNTQRTSRWKGFYSMALDGGDMRTIDDIVGKLKSGELPEPTRQVFPRPTILRVENLPGKPNNISCNLILYDVSGEAFEDAESLVAHAAFVKRSKTVMFLVSLPDLRLDEPDVAEGMTRLLNTYVLGMADLGGNTKDQDLVVVFTKADELQEELEESFGDVLNYVRTQKYDRGAPFTKNLQRVSQRLREFTREQLRAPEFINFADERFRTVGYSIVSATGFEKGRMNEDSSSPAKLEMQIQPRCVMDALAWIIIRTVFPRAF